MKISEMRKKRGLTQVELANLAGVNLRTLQNLEVGTRAVNKAAAENVIKIAIALAVHPKELLVL